MNMFIRCIGLCLFLVLPALSAAWGQDGHQVIGQIAQDHLTPEANEAVHQLLAPGETLASVASWADAVRREREHTGPWHYINWPLADDEPTTHPLCMEEGNVVRALDEQLAILTDKTQPAEIRAEALKYIVHFVGDLHQPLHAGTGDDRGGNSVKVIFDGANTNLHSVWDSKIIQSWAIPTWQLVSELEADLNPAKRESIERGSIYTWTVESHRYSRDEVYAKLPKSESETSQPDLATEYAAQMTPLVRQRLLEGGVRLARVLNGALGAEAP